MHELTGDILEEVGVLAEAAEEIVPGPLAKSKGIYDIGENSRPRGKPRAAMGCAHEGNTSSRRNDGTVLSSCFMGKDKSLITG
jgi:hypothetical protein